MNMATTRSFGGRVLHIHQSDQKVYMSTLPTYHSMSVNVKQTQGESRSIPSGGGCIGSCPGYGAGIGP